MFRKTLAFGLFVSLVLSGMFMTPVSKAEEDEEFYEDEGLPGFTFLIAMSSIVALVISRRPRF